MLRTKPAAYSVRRDQGDAQMDRRGSDDRIRELKPMREAQLNGQVLHGTVDLHQFTPVQERVDLREVPWIATMIDQGFRGPSRWPPHRPRGACRSTACPTPGCAAECSCPSPADHASSRSFRWNFTGSLCNGAVPTRSVKSAPFFRRARFTAFLRTAPPFRLVVRLVTACFIPGRVIKHTTFRQLPTAGGGWRPGAGG